MEEQEEQFGGAGGRQAGEGVRVHGASVRRRRPAAVLRR